MPEMKIAIGGREFDVSCQEGRNISCAPPRGFSIPRQAR